ncbi:hypothetical protein CspHIS471_0305710 [Cutaneotrichosporon sp. HIS471]|nr:hypothetical protein CspHIS471_0305710 [Cutaneotrichosporon sp. HIS471]
MVDLGSNRHKRRASERDNSPDRVTTVSLAGGRKRSFSFGYAESFPSSPSGPSSSPPRTTWPHPTPEASFFGSSPFLGASSPSKSNEERSSKRHCPRTASEATNVGPPSLNLPTLAETPISTPSSSSLAVEVVGAHSLVPLATTPPPPNPDSPSPSDSIESFQFRPRPTPNLSEMFARANRNEWRQRCEDLFNRVDRLNSDARLDADTRFDVDLSFDADCFDEDHGFDTDCFFYTNGFYNNSDSDDDGANYNPTVAKDIRSAHSVMGNMIPALTGAPQTMLRFTDIPWPVQIQIPGPWKKSISASITEDDVKPENVRAFVHALAEDEGVDERQVVADALWYFDPDRFDDEVLPRIWGSDRRVVQVGAETVWRSLTDILAHPDTSELTLLEVDAGNSRQWEASLFAPTVRPLRPAKLLYS